MSDELTPPAAATPSADPSPAVATPAAPAAPAAPTPAPATPGGPSEPPQGYVPSFRLRETTEKYQQAQQHWQAQEARYQEQLQQAQRQRDALLGIQPPEDPNAAQVRQQFAQLFPTLAKFEEQGISPEQIAALVQRAGDMEAQQNHYWQSYGRQSMDRLYDLASQTLGSPLTAQAKDALHAAFTGYISSSPELVQRYASDPSLLQEFWSAFSSSFIEPARRLTASAVTTSAATPLPRDTTGGIRTTPPPAFQSMDDRVNAAWSQYQQNAKK